MKINPPASPRRNGGTCGSTVGAASTISTPPASPAAKRQRVNHRNDQGVAQAKKASVASAIIARSATGAGTAAVTRRASSAPAR